MSKLKAPGSMTGKAALSFAKRAKSKDFTVMIPTKLIPLLKPHKNMRIVDFCTGTGNIIPFFKGIVKEFVAIDASQDMINILKKNFKHKFLKVIKSDVSKVPLKSGRYDAVITKFSLHHLYDADPAVKEAYRILKKRGKFYIIDMVFEDSFIYRIIEPFWIIKYVFKHGIHELFCRYRDDKQISKLLTDNKFRITCKEKLNEDDKIYRNKHYPTYIYKAVK